MGVAWHGMAFFLALPSWSLELVFLLYGGSRLIATGASCDGSNHGRPSEQFADFIFLFETFVGHKGWHRRDVLVCDESI